MIKSPLPLLIYQPNENLVADQCIKLNQKVFDDVKCIKEVSYEPFDKIYKHMSTNYIEFESLCFLRFFHMLNYVKNNKIDKFLYCDSDAVYLKYLDFEGMLGKNQCLACKPFEQDEYEDVVSAHFSIWTKDGLESFCDFILDIYGRNIEVLMPKWEWHQKTGIAGGICDMTLLFHWYKPQESLFSYRNGATFDRGIALSDNGYKKEMIIENGIKKIVKTPTRMFGYKTDGNLIELLGIHFQGSAKQLIFNL
jgi:hypothetical protein